MHIGVAAYSCYFPAPRLGAAALKQAWGSAPRGLVAKPVADLDEDALTLLIAAGRPLAVDGCTALAVASRSLPYSQRVQAGLVAEALDLGRDLYVSEHTTSARAGTEALLALQGVLQSAGGSGLLLAADVATGSSAAGADAALGAGAAGFLLAPDGAVAQIEAAQSYVAEEPGLRFTRAGEAGQRDVQVPDYAADAYQAAVAGAARALLRRVGQRMGDYRFLVLNPPEPGLTAGTARALGAAEEQWQPVWTFPHTGDVGAAQPLVGLVAALDAAQPGDRILLAAYGSGSACDALSLIAGPGAGRGALRRALAPAREIDYLTYLKLRGAI